MIEFFSKPLSNYLKYRACFSNYITYLINFVIEDDSLITFLKKKKEEDNLITTYYVERELFYSQLHEFVFINPNPSLNITFMITLTWNFNSL